MELIEEFEKLKVGEIVRKNPKSAAVFSDIGIDFCCGGNVLFSDACKLKGFDSQEVWQNVLKASMLNNSGADLDFDGFELGFLADYIVNVHHKYLYDNLPEVRFFVDKVYFKHGDRYAYLKELYELFNALEADLIGHLPKEENMLFPFIKQMLQIIRSKNTTTSPFFLSINNPIMVMLSEHDEAGTILHRLREITNNYTATDDACNSHLVMMDKLRELDNDLIKHIHLENNILFPKAIALEENYYSLK